MLDHANRPFRTLPFALVLGGAFLPVPVLAQEATRSTLLALPPLSVTANRVATPAAETGSALTVITGEELERRQTRILSDALREVPGVAVNRTGPMGSLTQIRIRGSEGNQTLVIVDGIEMNDPSSGSEYDFANLLAGDVERVEVLRGPQSALYGSDAVGGVVNIVTRRGKGPLAVKAAVEGGSFGTAAGRASLATGNDRYDLSVSGQGVLSDGVSVADKRRGNPEKDGYRNGTLAGNFAVRPTGNSEIGVVGRYTRFRTDGDDFVGGRGAVDSGTDTTGEQYFGRIQGKAAFFDGRWEHIVGLSYGNQQRDYRNSAKLVTSRYEGRKTKADYQTNLTLNTGPAEHVLTAAIEHEDEKAISKSSFANFDRSIGTTGLVGQYKLGLFDRLTLTGSVRHDDNDLFRDATTWRTTAAYLVEATDTKLRASYGTGVKNPTLFELYGYTATFRGNPNLKPEKGRGWDAGFDQPLWGKRASVDATWFNQRIRDQITGTGTSAINLPGEARVRGAELGLSVEPVDGLLLRGSYTLTDGVDSSGNELVRRPKQLASLNVNYRFLDDRANANLGIVYNGRTSDWAYDAFYNRQVVNLAPYTLVNLSGSYKLTEQVDVFGRVENLFDRHYQEVWTYGTPGRAGYVGLRLSL
ncbi:TonB-dependent receptor plug domain-containing protein [Azospirillum doebereinerae]|uniref:TonB-dependent receptor plug domain-containing protein n=1 Tax=Azospirillum doebereinerae TaxID=92933 RepID=UPI001EE5A9AD|nr:TonB-dependent receptor [Azospirillum doebereinerae]MCG5244066.1 TonB-dependent receptor [Azospirillum doebereinerae]